MYSLQASSVVKAGNAFHLGYSAYLVAQSQFDLSVCAPVITTVGHRISLTSEAANYLKATYLPVVECVKMI